MNDSFGGGFTQQGAEGKQEKKAEGTLPVFIKQVLSQTEDTTKMWGFEYKMVTTVAIVRNVEHSSTKITYTLEDFSGTINAHLWVEEGDAPDATGIMLNTYARVIGAVRQQGDTKSIMIYKIQPVKSVNEVNTHLIEVVNARYQAEEYSKNGCGAGDTGTKMEVENASVAAPSGSHGELKGKSSLVFNAIKVIGEMDPDRGASVAEMKLKFPHIQDEELRQILTFLSQEGHIYSTIDSNHFVACY